MVERNCCFLVCVLRWSVLAAVAGPRLLNAGGGGVREGSQGEAHLRRSTKRAVSGSDERGYRTGAPHLRNKGWIEKREKKQRSCRQCRRSLRAGVSRTFRKTDRVSNARKREQLIRQNTTRRDVSVMWAARMLSCVGSFQRRRDCTRLESTPGYIATHLQEHRRNRTKNEEQRLPSRHVKPNDVRRASFAAHTLLKSKTGVLR